MNRVNWQKHEPDFNPMDYSGSLLASLKFYNSDVDDDDKKDWTISYWKAQGKPTAYFDKINGASFAQLGVLIRIMERGYTIEPQHQKFIDDEYFNILARANRLKPESSKINKEVQSPADIERAKKEVLDKALKEICADIDAEFDHITEFGTRKYDVKTHLGRNKNLVALSESLSNKYAAISLELRAALDGSDKQIKEGYSQYSKKTLRMLCDFADSIVTACTNAKPTRKPRKKKVISISKIVSKVKYLRAYPDLQMTSVSPESIVGAKVVYLFNVKLNKLYRYLGTHLSVHGSAIIDYNLDVSFAKTIRKPECFFQGINDMAQRTLDKKIQEIPGVSAKVSGRLTEDMIILKTY